LEQRVSFDLAYAVALAGIFGSMFLAGAIGNKYKLSDGWRLVILFVLWAVVFVVCQIVYINFGYEGT
jgi:hypothetical protein